MKTNTLYWKSNEQIKAPQLRVLDSDNKQIGVMSREEALSEAKSKGKDLVEIAPLASPPVVKIVELDKFRYQEEKKLKKQQIKAKSSEIKEVRFSPFIGDHDYNTRLERVKEFLNDKNKVKLVVVFKGRQMGSKPFGYELFEKIVDSLSGTISVDMAPKFLGRHLTMIISPLIKKVSVKKPDLAEQK